MLGAVELDVVFSILEDERDEELKFRFPFRKFSDCATIGLFFFVDGDEGGEGVGHWLIVCRGCFGEFIDGGAIEPYCCWTLTDEYTCLAGTASRIVGDGNGNEGDLFGIEVFNLESVEAETGVFGKYSDPDLNRDSGC